jgi:hypothetical protein
VLRTAVIVTTISLLSIMFLIFVASEVSCMYVCFLFGLAIGRAKQSVVDKYLTDEKGEACILMITDTLTVILQIDDRRKTKS